MKNFCLLALFILFKFYSAQAADLPEINLEIKDNKFVPATLIVPKDIKFRLIIKNSDSTAEEFESKELNREKLIGPGKTVTVFIGPLASGSYSFFGEFHPTIALGQMVAQ